MLRVIISIEDPLKWHSENLNVFILGLSIIINLLRKPSGTCRLKPLFFAIDTLKNLKIGFKISKLAILVLIRVCFSFQVKVIVFAYFLIKELECMCVYRYVCPCSRFGF